jgi:hypothetical protein
LLSFPASMAHTVLEIPLAGSGPEQQARLARLLRATRAAERLTAQRRWQTGLMVALAISLVLAFRLDPEVKGAVAALVGGLLAITAARVVRLIRLESHCERQTEELLDLLGARRR